MQSTKGRSLVHYTFEDGSIIELTITGEVGTAAALKMATTLINLKLEEIGTEPPQQHALRVAG